LINERQAMLNTDKKSYIVIEMRKHDRRING